MANDALFSEKPGDLRASVNRDSFFPDGLRDSECRRTTLRSDRRDSDLGHGTEPYDSSSWPSDLFADTFYRGAAASRVVVTYERAPSWRSTRRDLDDPAMTSPEAAPELPPLVAHSNFATKNFRVETTAMHSRSRNY